MRYIYISHVISHRCAIAQNRLCRIQCAYRRYEVVRALTWFSEFDSRLVYSKGKYLPVYGIFVAVWSGGDCVGRGSDACLLSSHPPQ